MRIESEDSQLVYRGWIYLLKSNFFYQFNSICANTHDNYEKESYK